MAMGWGFASGRSSAGFSVGCAGGCGGRSLIALVWGVFSGQWTSERFARRVAGRMLMAG